MKNEKFTRVENELQDKAMLFLKERDERVFNSIYKDLQVYLRRFLYKKFPNSTKEDKMFAIDDTIIAVWKNFGDYDESKSSFKTWTTTIAFRMMLARLRVSLRNKRVISFSSLTHGSDGLTEANNTIQNLILEQKEEEVPIYKLKDFEDEIGQLSPIYREVLWDKYILKKSYKEMEEETGTTKNTLKTRARQGLMKIAKNYGVNKSSYRRF